MKQTKRIAIIGAGGFARELAWLISDIASQPSPSLRPISEILEFSGFLVSEPAPAARNIRSLLGDFDWLEKNHIDALAMGIGTPAVRLRLSQELKQRFPQIPWPRLIHPSVRYDESCQFAEGVTLCAGTIATVNVRIDAFAMINLSCTIGHETAIGAGSVVNPLTAISGAVTIGQGVLVGTHAAILQGVSIGDHAVVGSGAMVNKDVAPHVTVMGVPARAKSMAASALT